MFHTEDERVRQYLLKGNFGLEKEGLRVTPDGCFAHTPHPFPGDEHIVRDFCENQTEINTEVEPSAEAAQEALYRYTVQIEKTLSGLPERELLWPFSNPPYIRNEADIPVAQFEGGRASKTDYREYLSDRYGRYKMTLCGIHVNYSYSDELLEADYGLSGQKDFQSYKNEVYLSLAQKAAAYGWMITALTAASPLVDSSFLEKGVRGGTGFVGMASIRCSELGYWNYFAPVFDYTDAASYADSIQKYVDNGMLAAPTELYYPIRLKPRGKNRLDRLREGGIDHIELRMVDLNPLEPSGISLYDLRFIQLFLVWLSCIPDVDLDANDQVLAVQNFKSAARYDLKTVKIAESRGRNLPAADEGLLILDQMKAFYEGSSGEIRQVLDYEEGKFRDPDSRYAWIIRKEYADGFLEKGLALAENRQKELTCVNFLEHH